MKKVNPLVLTITLANKRGYRVCKGSKWWQFIGKVAT